MSYPRESTLHKLFELFSIWRATHRRGDLLRWLTADIDRVVFWGCMAMLAIAVAKGWL